MTTAAIRVLRQAASRIGYYAPDDPEPGSEAGRYLAAKMGQPWLRGPSASVWWCMAFVSMCLDLEGQADAIGGLSYNTDTTLSHVRAGKGGSLVSVAQARAGDVVIFDWDGGGTDHVGLVEKNLGGGVLQTIEGNTSSGARGSQSAGNGVWRRKRSASIAAVIRPAYTDGSGGAAGAPTGAVTSTDGQLVLDLDGIPGPRTIARLQQVMGTPIDGVVSRPSTVIKALQRFLNGAVGAGHIRALVGDDALAVDGYAGPKTWKVFQFLAWCWDGAFVGSIAPGWSLGRWCDGDPGVRTWKALQHMLNGSYAGSGRLL